MNYTSLFDELIDVAEAGRQKISNIKPTDWAESRRILSSDNSAFPGPFSFDRTPYLREPLDHFSPDSPMRYMAVMKGGQIGFSTGLIENAIGWIISENPGTILFLSGHDKLSEEAMNEKIDPMIESCGIRHLIRPSVRKKKNQRTGDTATSKEFPGGSLKAGTSSNHSLLRQRSVRYGLYDDFENAPRSTKESGSTEKMILQRHAAYKDKKKVAFISTPELEDRSNIKPVFLKGDQRRYKVPCPCCAAYIFLYWSTDLNGSDGRDKAGITWKLDEKGRLIDGVLVGEENSVGYICQECGGFFDESHKYAMNLAGFWEPTAEPSETGYYSYHISCLYAPPGMDDWTHYVRQFLEANPPGQPQKEHLQKTFVNLVLAETFTPSADELKANDLQENNIRQYNVGTIPEHVSVNDGNGKIFLVTCACDLNGREDDARLDYEVVAWSETGVSYSVTHGSIGTFVPRESYKKIKEDRERWTYEFGKKNSVWPELDKVLRAEYLTDTGRKMRIVMGGVDCGKYSVHAYAFVDKLNSPFRVGLKGRDETKYTRLGLDLPPFKAAKERSNLFLIEVNSVKDDLADLIRLKWDPFVDDQQPPGFMNYPIPSDGKYLLSNYFSHFEAEKRVMETKEGVGVGIRWEKKNSAVQNHFWDIRVYSLALRDIFADMICKDLKLKSRSWADYVNAMKGIKG